jgi:hypothetical protein
LDKERVATTLPIGQALATVKEEGTMADSSPTYLTTVEVADLCRTSPETVRYWRFKGDYGPRSFKVGRRVLYARVDVEDWLNAERDRAEAAVPA